jgi:catechol 2,3-dioxygenase-like lactoylglutathione lyase family enzyme
VMKASIDLHHVHLFSSDIEKSVAFYERCFDGHVSFDGTFGGARNVFMKIGSGAIHFYDQPPRGFGPSSIHHIGIRTDDLQSLYERLLSLDVSFRSGIREFGTWRYIMCPAPDDVLIEIFQIDADLKETDAHSYFFPTQATGAKR